MTKKALSTGARRGEQSYAILGRRYEESCQAVLRTIGIDARLMGGPNDGGVDLRGTWRLCIDEKLKQELIPVIAQCKYISRDCPPAFVRELEGSLSRHPGTLGILLSSKPASRACVEALLQSPFALLYFLSDGTNLQRALGNASLHKALPSLVIGSRHVEGQVRPVFFVKE